MTHSITLQQFEQIDGLLSACLRRPELDEALMARGGEYVRSVYFTPEWKLFDALVDVFGYEASHAFPSAEAWGAEVVTRALSSASFVEAA